MNTKGIGQGEVGMFTQRVKVGWLCLALMFSQSQVWQGRS